ncbi:MAG: translational GTPase TypA [Eubacteriaceae bacterium]|nr:translational GTPase TypA [Eubacteriaceae bacterium]
MEAEKIRNVAIIAHVDHGKTTLVDAMLKQSGVCRDNQVIVDRVMDSNDIERERGITILSKNTAVNYGGYKINIVDTPGHADFGGEVERILKMVDGVILLVDAAEGPLPQTRFVLSKSLELQHKVIIVINKIDRPDARTEEVMDEILDLLIDLGADDSQLDSPMLYCSARQGICSYDMNEQGKDLKPLFDTIIKYIPAPDAYPDKPLKMLISAIDYNDFVGRIAIGNVICGSIRANEQIAVCNYHDPSRIRRSKAVNLYIFDKLERVPVDEAEAGNIVAISGIEDITIGDTICAPNHVEPIPFIKIDDPTVEMTFSVNDSPFAGRDGKYVTSRNIRDRLYKELLKDVSLKVSDTETTEAFSVAGRGEMHLSILIETMRREGYEFQVSPPRIITREINGIKCEPVEELVCDVPLDYVGSVIQRVSERKGELNKMTSAGSRTRLEFFIPSRGLFGYRSEFLTDTKGEGIMTSVFHDYQPYKGEIERRTTGSLVAWEQGTAVTYGLFNAQGRGLLFIGPGEEVYEGMIVGINSKPGDLIVNVCKQKQLSNMRAVGHDDKLKLVPVKQMSLEQCLEFLADDELLEVTPHHLRMRKGILNKESRLKAQSKKS